jgi:hypothetical protein
LIPATFDVNAVRHEVFYKSAMIAKLFVVPAGVCITGVCDILTVLSVSAWFGGRIIHFAVCVFVLQASVSSSTFMSTTLSTMAMISDVGVNC